MSEAEFNKTQVLSQPVPDATPDGLPGVLRCVDTSVLKSPVGVEIKLVSREVTVGRGSENLVTLDAHGVSRTHARIYLQDGAWQLVDLGSTNGTRVNNSRVDRRALADGDTVAFGRVCYKFHVVNPQAGASSVMDLDLGAANQTVVLHPSQRQAQADPPPPPPPRPPAAEPGAEQIYDSGSRRKVTAPPAAANSSKTGLVIAAVVFLLAAVAAAAYFLGFN